MTAFFADATVAASLAAVGALANSGKLEVYSGTQPTGANETASGTVLVTFTMNTAAFGSASFTSADPTRTATITAGQSPALSATAGNTGTAAWFRLYKSDGTTVILDGAVGTSGADLNLSSLSITSGETVTVTSFAITQSE